MQGQGWPADERVAESPEGGKVPGGLGPGLEVCESAERPVVTGAETDG